MTIDTPPQSPASSQLPESMLKVPPPVWALGLLVLAFTFNRLFDWSILLNVTSLPLAILLAVTGVGVAGWSVLIFHQQNTEIIPVSPKNAKLITYGPYRATRNPMYAGLILLTAGIWLYIGTIPYLAVPILLFFLFDRGFIPFEEAKMRRQFDSSFADYESRVPRWI